MSKLQKHWRHLGYIQYLVLVLKTQSFIIVPVLRIPTNSINCCIFTSDIYGPHFRQDLVLAVALLAFLAAMSTRALETVNEWNEPGAIFDANLLRPNNVLSSRGSMWMRSLLEHLERDASSSYKVGPHPPAGVECVSRRMGLL